MEKRSVIAAALLFLAAWKKASGTSKSRTDQMEIAEAAMR
jgi:hypothetical protein